MNEPAHPVNVAAARRWLFRLLLIVAPVVCWLLWMASRFDGLANRDALDNAQAARHLAAGDGWVTSVIRPLSFAARPWLEQHPDQFNPPLFKLLTAAIFKLAGPSENMAALASGLGWMACGWLIYLMTVDLTGKRRAGALALMLWFMHLPAGNAAVAATNLVWSAALTTALFWTVMKVAQNRAAMPPEITDPAQALAQLPVKGAALSGVLAALLTLMQPALMWVAWLPLMAHWIRWPYRAGLPDRGHKYAGSIKKSFRFMAKAGYVGRLLGAFLLPAVILVMPWFLWVLAAGGAAFPNGLRIYEVLTNTADFPGDSIFRYAIKPDNTPWSFWIFDGVAAFKASLAVLPRLPEVWLQIAGMVPAALLLISFLGGSTPGIRALRGMAGGMLLSSIFFFSVLAVGAGYFFMFLPVFLMLGVAGLDRVLDSWLPVARAGSRKRSREPSQRWSRPLVIALVLGLSALPLINLRLRSPARPPAVVPPGLAHLQEQSQPDDIILTDAPWLVAWYGERAAVWLPQREEDLDAMLEQGARFDWIYLFLTRSIQPAEAGDWWSDIIQEGGWRDFKLVKERFRREFVLSR